MKVIRSAIENTVSISLFNRGLAGKIFEEVRNIGPKVVMKNNQPECVLLSPEEYISLLDKIDELKLLKLAEQRLKDPKNSKLIK